MANPPKKKGTAGETELMKLLGPDFRRTAPTLPYDLVRVVVPAGAVYEVLATRPDRGQWLVTMRLDDFIDALPADVEVHVEVKRYARFSLHTIFERKFGRTK